MYKLLSFTSRASSRTSRNWRHPPIPLLFLPFSHRAHCFPHSFSSSALPHVWRSCKVTSDSRPLCIEGGGTSSSRSDHFTGSSSLCLFSASTFLQSSPNWSNHVPANTMQRIVSPPSLRFFPPSLPLSATSVFLFNCWLFKRLGYQSFWYQNQSQILPLLTRGGCDV